MACREIKFRAWDGKRMIYDGDKVKPPHLRDEPDMAFSGAIVTNKGVEVWFYETRLPNAKDDYFDHRTGIKYKELLEYTGLKDKNGVEIYEGDILTGFLSVKSEVTFRDQIGRWEGIGNGYRLPAHKFDLSEVIGNIMENPELLDV